MTVRQLLEKSKNKNVYVKLRHAKNTSVLKENNIINQDNLDYFGDTCVVYKIKYDDYGNPLYLVDTL